VSERRVLQLPVGFLPWTVGGREVHTDRLARGLRELGWMSHVVIHQDLDHREPVGDTTWDGSPVTVLPSIEGQLDRSRIYRRLPAEVPGFAQTLDRVQPELVHFHDFSIGANLMHMREAHAAGLPTMLTFHSPGQSCLQTALLYRGQEFCDGRIDLHRCTECRLSVGGVPYPLAHGLAGRGAAGVLGRPFIRRDSGKVGRTLTARRMTELFDDAWREMIEGMERMIVHAKWQEDILLLNGVEPHKIVTIWNGIDTPAVEHTPPDPKRPLRLAFVGRCEEVKGPGVLIDAIERLPRTVEVQVHLFGLYWDTPYGQELQTRIKNDPRFIGPRALTPSEVIPTLATMDLCVVPPKWVEVDPQIVLESFAAGTPVIGSAGYGVSERVRDGVDGVLFPPGDDAELARVIASLAADREQLSRLTEGVASPRTIVDMAREVVVLYEEITRARIR
jgi:glycosyltransferase involved in cell wall biosynthesis